MFDFWMYHGWWLIAGFVFWPRLALALLLHHYCCDRNPALFYGAMVFVALEVYGGFLKAAQSSKGR